MKYFKIKDKNTILQFHIETKNLNVHNLYIKNIIIAHNINKTFSINSGYYI